MQNTSQDTKERYRVAIVAPNCFYYQVDLFRQLANHPRIELTVYFCSREGIESEDVSKMYGSDQGWGTEDTMLQGYKHKFLKNYSPWPSYLKSLVGLINLGIWNEIKNSKPDGIILMSWMNPTWWIAVLASLTSNVPYMLLTDANAHTEQSMSKLKKLTRKIALGQILFRKCSGFLCAGSQNSTLYNLYGVPNNKLFPFAYSSGYGPLLMASRELTPQKKALREEFQIPQESFMILFCGRLSNEKNPFHLLEAFSRLEQPQKALVFVGDGELKPALMRQVASDRIDSVYFPGFQDRNDVSKFYAMSDVLVLPSERETWGMVVNEAMCFSLPIIVSDAVGAGEDMVLNGQNGFCFTSGDVDGLFESIKKIAEMPEEVRMAMGKKSLQLITDWTQRDLGGIMSQCLDSTYAARSR